MNSFQSHHFSTKISSIRVNIPKIIFHKNMYSKKIWTKKTSTQPEYHYCHVWRYFQSQVNHTQTQKFSLIHTDTQRQTYTGKYIHIKPETHDRQSETHRSRRETAVVTDSQTHWITHTHRNRLKQSHTIRHSQTHSHPHPQ